MILAGDIGGTRARLALYDGPRGKAVFESRGYKSLEAVVQAFLEPKLLKRVRAATFGIAGPVIDQRCAATNFPWVVDARAVSRKLGIRRVTLLNDLVSLAFGALTVARGKVRLLHGSRVPGKGRVKGTIAVIAAGTGLGEAGLVWDGERYLPLPTEGGHADFAARSALEWELYGWLERRFGHVSYERIVAGPGLSHLYDFFQNEKSVADTKENLELLAASADRNAAITELGLAGKSEPAGKALELFARIYGAETGNLALKTLATGGVYVAGGIAGKLAEYLAKSGFVEAYLDKGRFRGLLEGIPVAVVLDSDIGLAGSRYHAAMM